MNKLDKVKLDKTLRSSFKEVGEDKKAYILLLNGKRVQVNNGKKVWNSSGAAKNALNNHFNGLYYGGMYGGTDYDWNAKKEAELAAKECAKHNIQVISIGEYEAIQAKLKSK